MFPEDRVLVAAVPHPADFVRARDEHWYRIPVARAPKGMHAEVIAFYFGGRFGEQKWAVHYFAENLGHELKRRVDLISAEPDHPRAQDLYYQIKLGEMQALPRPIPSLRRRRILFIHTTWDRLQDATEINDLVIRGGDYEDRLYATLKERGVQAERDYRVEEAGQVYHVPLCVPTATGRIDVSAEMLPTSDAELNALVARIVAAANPDADQGASR